MIKLHNGITYRTIFLGSILSIVGLFVLQFFVLKLESFLITVAIPEYIAICISSVLYPVLNFCCLKLFIEKILRIPLSALRFKKIKINTVAVIIAIMLPVLVIICYQFVPGEWLEISCSQTEKFYLILRGICFYCVSTSLSEEMVFRGVIMGLIEKRTNIKIAVLVPSILFSLAHVFNAKLDFMEFCQLMVSGTAVGVFFSLISYYYDSFWNNAIVHAFWNASTIGILHIGTKIYKNSIYTYVIKSRSKLITGGNFGFESSIISTIIYCVFIIILLIMIRKKFTH